jgi:glycerol kinase
MQAERYLLAIDQGTTGTKVIAVDGSLRIAAEAYFEFPQHFPQPGWVEHDLEEIWKSITDGIASICRRIDPKKITGIGITNQRETVGFWSKKTKRPLCNAIVWQDRRTAALCAQLKEAGKEEAIRSTTGLLIDPYFSGTKIRWALENIESVRSANASNDLVIGTIDTFIVSRLTNGSSFITEASNASRTLLMDLRTLQWSDEMLGEFRVSKDSLPEIKHSFDHFGVTTNVPGLPDGIPICGILGDQQSALLGQTCISEGQAKCTYGTGAFILMNCGSTPPVSKHRLLSTVAWNSEKEGTTYALEGSAFMAGATVQWLRDGLQIIQASKDIELLASSVPDSGGITFVPAFTGLGAPYWDPHVRAAIFGLSRGTTQAHIARAALEGVTLQIADILEAMEKDLGKQLKQLAVDGGAAKNNLMMQIQCDYLGRTLVRPKITQTTAMGAIFAAGIGAGVWKSLEEASQAWALDREFNSSLSEEKRAKKLLNWRRHIHALQEVHAE